MRLWSLPVLAAAAAFSVPGDAAAQAPRLEGTVDPGFTISPKLPGGGDVRQLDPGTYEIVVRNLSDFHNFHLSGPGVEQSTSVGFEGNGNLDGHVPRGVLPRRNAIALRTASGSHVHALKSGAYTITVRDRTAKHSFHLSGGGVNKKTASPRWRRSPGR